MPSYTEVPRNTNWVDFSNNQISQLYGNSSYLWQIRWLNLSKNHLQYIDDHLLDNFHNLGVLDLSKNSLKILPKTIVKLTKLREVWLADNPFTCNCSTLWMINWMRNFTTGTNHVKIVKDYYYINCSNGEAVYKLDPVKMGCFPKNRTLWQKILIGLSVVTIVIVIASIAISRRWNEVQWFMYLHFDYLGKNDGNENLVNKKFDAFLSYR